MKPITNFLRGKWMLLLSFVFLYFISCEKDSKFPESAGKGGHDYGHLVQTKMFSASVVVKWLDMELDMLRVPLAVGTGSQDAARALAYCGIAAYESVVPGMPAYQSLTNQLNQFPEMPPTEPGKAYHWAASANAALADMNRKLFPTTSDANKLKIDSLENALQDLYATEADGATLQRSITFGKEVAKRIYDWAGTDGSANINPPYVPPTGDGLWESTPPNFPSAANPYASQRRLMTPGVTDRATLEPPPSYSTDPASSFYTMVKDVYDKSQHLTAEDTAMAIYHRDAPGYPGGGHFVGILSQVLSKAQPALDIAALAYAKTGIASYDALAICFTIKYSVNLVRPITYIQKVMGYTSWSALFNTPGHPEFPSAHAVNAAAISGMWTDVFGENFEFTLHSYDYIGLPPRPYNSFEEMAKEMADSRVLAGIHYQPSVDKGLWLGEKVTQNILSKLKFHK
jgi:hypothetical protein